MHYLIDGHNLIGQMPDISLKDPNDEAKLVLRLRSWTAAGGKRQVTVIFDGGLPGGAWRYMSKGRIKAIFATEGQTADALLVNRIRQVNNPSAYTLVTSDQEILEAARKRRMPFMTSQAFAQHLEKIAARQENEEVSSKSVAEELELSAQEVDEWLSIFQSAAEPENVTSSPALKPAAQEQEQPKSSDSTEPPTSRGAKGGPAILKSGNRKLSSDEVDEWLELFQDSGED